MKQTNAWPKKQRLGLSISPDLKHKHNTHITPVDGFLAPRIVDYAVDDNPNVYTIVRHLVVRKQYE